MPKTFTAKKETFITMADVLASELVCKPVCGFICSHSLFILKMTLFISAPKTLPQCFISGKGSTQVSSWSGRPWTICQFHDYNAHRLLWGWEGLLYGVASMWMQRIGLEEHRKCTLGQYFTQISQTASSEVELSYNVYEYKFHICAVLRSLLRAVVHYRPFSHSSLSSVLILQVRTSSPRSQRRLSGSITVCSQSISESLGALKLAVSVWLDVSV